MFDIQALPVEIKSKIVNHIDEPIWMFSTCHCHTLADVNIKTPGDAVVVSVWEYYHNDGNEELCAGCYLSLEDGCTSGCLFNDSD